MVMVAIFNNNDSKFYFDWLPVTGLRGEAFKKNFPHVKLNPAAAAIKNANFHPMNILTD